MTWARFVEQQPEFIELSYPFGWRVYMCLFWNALLSKYVHPLPLLQEDEADEEDLGVGKGATLPVTVDEAEEEAQKRALKTSRSSSSGQDQEAVTNQPLRRKSSGSSNPQ